MPSVCDVTQLPKNSSAYVLAKAKVGKREEGETYAVSQNMSQNATLFLITLSVN